MALSSKDKQELLDQLEEALFKGVRSIKFRDKEIVYRTVKEMQDLRSILRKELGLSPKCVRLFASHSKGFC